MFGPKWAEVGPLKGCGPKWAKMGLKRPVVRSKAQVSWSGSAEVGLNPQEKS